MNKMLQTKCVGVVLSVKSENITLRKNRQGESTI